MVSRSQEEHTVFSIEFSQAGEIERISCMQAKDGSFYAVIPRNVSLSSVRLRLHGGGSAVLDGQAWEDAFCCGDLDFNTDYPLTYTWRGNAYSSGFAVLSAGGNGALFIDTHSGNMEYVHGNKGNKEAGNYVLYGVEGNIDSSGALSAVWVRGNYTWYASDKKAYGVTLSKEADLLDMGSATEWILLANAADPTHLRNQLVYSFAEALGMEYSPDSRWVDLYLNGEYAGLYQLCERNEIASDRVDISQETGVLVSLELEERFTEPGIRFIKTDSGQVLRIRSKNELTEEQEKLWQMVENAIMAENGIDPISGKSYCELIDLESWAKKLLIEEFFGNIDGGVISQYFYTEGEKVFAGPVWDYDLSMGVEARWIWQLTESKAIFAIREEVKAGITAPWFAALWQKDEFRNYALSIYREEFLPLMELYVSEWIPDQAEKLAHGVTLDAIRWKEGVQTTEEQTEYLICYLRERMEFLDSLWLQNEKYCFVQINDGLNSNYAYYALLPGEHLEALPEPDGSGAEFQGWYYADSGEPFDIHRPITENIAIFAKWHQVSETGLGQIVKLAPLGVIGLLGIVLLVFELRRNWKRK